MGHFENETRKIIRNGYALTPMGQRLQAGDKITVNDADHEACITFLFGVIAVYRTSLEGLAAEIDRLRDRVADLEGR